MTTNPPASTDVQILVIHVRGNHTRRAYVEKQIAPLGFHVKFIEDGNIGDLTPELLHRYFVDDGTAETMCRPTPRTSCAYKHLLATQYIIDHNLPGALILEDDIRLKNNFKPLFLKSLKEIESIREPLIANYEESSLMLVPRSQRRKGQLLYKAERDRFAGCMYITQEAAKVIMKYVEENKSAYTSDILHQELTRLGVIAYYWSHPCLACQCSCDGSMPTMIPTRPRPFKRLKWFYKKVYKTILYYLWQRVSPTP